jgi:hypothetical protein
MIFLAIFFIFVLVCHSIDTDVGSSLKSTFIFLLYISLVLYLHFFDSLTLVDNYQD